MGAYIADSDDRRKLTLFAIKNNIQRHFAASEND